MPLCSVRRNGFRPGIMPRAGDGAIQQQKAAGLIRTMPIGARDRIGRSLLRQMECRTFPSVAFPRAWESLARNAGLCRYLGLRGALVKSGDVIGVAQDLVYGALRPQSMGLLRCQGCSSYSRSVPVSANGSLPRSRSACHCCTPPHATRCRIAMNPCACPNWLVPLRRPKALG